MIGQQFDVEKFLKSLDPMLWHLAYRFGCEYEELRQEAALFVLQRVRRMPEGMESVSGYLHNAVQNHIVGREYLGRPRVQTTSIDAPMFEEDGEGSLGLADHLAAPAGAGERDTSHEDQRVVALYAALRRLDLEEQQYMREVFQLNAYEPAIYAPYPPARYCQRGTIRKSAYRRLRRDAQLAAAILGGRG